MSNVSALLADWVKAKAAEDAAQRQRRKIETQLESALEVPNEGSKTTEIDGFKVTVTQPVYRKVDAVAWEAIKTRISENLWPVKTKVEADPTGCKYLANNEPEIWAQIAEAFETKPGKVGFKVVEVGE